VTPTLGVAFAAGLLSFLSPCVLPLVPTYLAYIGGSGAAKRALLLRNALLFVLGFSLVFIAMGASASALGSLLRDYRSELMVVGGIIVIGFGLVMLGIVRVPFLYRDTRRPMGEDVQPQTPWGALALGSAFGFAWTPCIGPVLGGILTVAGASGTLATGVGLLAVYSLGLAIPFLLAAIAIDPFLRVSRGIRPYLRWVERVAGVLLVVIGLLMVTGTFTTINTVLLRFTPDWLFQRL
jgi:cytochrome c-type biogenesis protein